MGGVVFVCVCCKPELSVLMAGPGICIQSCYTLSISASLTCICLWQISQIQTCLRVVVGPGLVSTSPAFMRSIASHPVCPHGRFSKKKRWGREGSTQYAQGLPDRCDGSTACRLCRLEHSFCHGHLLCRSQVLP